VHRLVRLVVALLALVVVVPLAFLVLVALLPFGAARRPELHVVDDVALSGCCRGRRPTLGKQQLADFSPPMSL
jgi:hypothetical protein